MNAAQYAGMGSVVAAMFAMQYIGYRITRRR